MASTHRCFISIAIATDLRLAADHRDNANCPHRARHCTGDEHAAALVAKRSDRSFQRSQCRTPVRLALLPAPQESTAVRAGPALRLTRASCLPSTIVLLDLPHLTANPKLGAQTMKPIALLIVCLGLSACATEYASQLYQPDYGIRTLHYSPGDVDPTLLMNGSYASKQMNGGFRALCLTDYRCSPQAQQSSSGWNP